MISGIIVILIGWYFIVYRLNKKDYERRYNKELRFRDTLNPEYWHKLH